jgi:hypothetical protein
MHAQAFLQYGADERRDPCAGPVLSLNALNGWHYWSNETPIDGRLNEAGAEVEISGGVGLEADFQSACAFACEPIEAGRHQHSAEAAALVFSEGEGARRGRPL